MVILGIKFVGKISQISHSLELDTVMDCMCRTSYVVEIGVPKPSQASNKVSRIIHNKGSYFTFIVSRIVSKNSYKISAKVPVTS